MAFTPTITTVARATAQTNLLNGIDSRRGFGFEGEQFAELITDVAPFTAMLLKASRVAVNDPDKKYMEHRPSWLTGKTFYANEAIACSATHTGQSFATIDVELTAGGADAVPWLVAAANLPYELQIVDADDSTKFCNFLVRTIHSTTNVTLTQLTDAPGFDVAAEDVINIIGTMHPEGGSKTYAFSDKATMRWASTQIFKTSAKATRTTMKSWVAGGNEWDRIKMEAGDAHGVDIERAFIFGGRYPLAAGANDPFGAPVATAVGGTANAPVRSTVSLQQASRYADDVGMGGSRVYSITKATYTYSDFIDDLETLFEYGAETRWFFGGRAFLSFLTVMALDENSGIEQKNMDVNSFGVKFHEFYTPHGTLKYVVHPLFKGVYTNKAFAVDMDNVEALVFDDTFVEDVTAVGYDGIEEQYLTDIGLCIKLPEATVSEWTAI